MNNKLTAEQIQENWNKFLSLIESYIPGERGEKLKNFYLHHEDHLVLMPASHRRDYHNAIPGGYIDHVVRVIEAALEIDHVWKKFEVDSTTYTTEELVFSAINHDLGKMGNGELYAHQPSTDNWRKDKLGEFYQFNKEISFMKVPDRGLWLLSNAGIEISENEWIAIKTHDGLYDEGNTAYLKAFMNEARPRTSLPFILHQADMLAARIEWEKEWLQEFKKSEGTFEKKESGTTKKPPKTQAALKSVGEGNEGLKSMIDNL